jgi:glycosyltransferase involved in cell wall biosynthesis
VAMVHYRDAAEAGGSLRVGETIANNLDPDKVRAAMVFAYGGPGTVARHARVPCHYLGARGPKDFSAWLRARAAFRELRPDIVHFQDAVVWLRAALLASSYRKIVHVHGRYEKNSPSTTGQSHPFRASNLFHAYLKLTDAQVFISSSGRKSLLDLGWISSERSYVIYNAIDLARQEVTAAKSKARVSLGLPRDAKLLGMVCRLVKEKGCADLLSIVAKLPASWHGVICGEGPERRRLQEESAARNLADRIHFLGCQEEVTQVYAAIDAYAFLSTYEPFGLVMAEAMAARVPVFAVMADGEYAEQAYPLVTPETTIMIHGGRDTQLRLIEPAINQLVSELEQFGNHPEKYQQLIDRARIWVAACFDGSIQAAAMTRVYEDLCDKTSTGEISLGDWYDHKRRAAEELMVTGGHVKAVASL